jgi:SAM-dependent methyltransferase
MMATSGSFGRNEVRLLVVLALFVGALVAINVMVDFADVSTPRGVKAYILTGLAIYWSFPLIAYSQRKRIAAAFAHLQRIAETGIPPAASGRMLDLFIISFVVLFVETMLIRYIGSQTRIFAFYKNIPLIGAFLGLGIGCFQGKGGRKEVLYFLVGTALVALFFAAAAQALGAVLGISASAASSEQVFGDYQSGNVPQFLTRVMANLHVGLYCVAVFLGLAWLFAQLGRILAVNFDGLPRLGAYTVNILGSLAGLIVFVGLSRFYMPPWVWFLVGLLPLLHWLRQGLATKIGLAAIALAAIAVTPHLHTTVWSAYQKLVGREIPHGYRIDISDAFYQYAFDLSPQNIASMGRNPLPYYDAEFEGRQNLDHVLVVGAGSGNDVAAALRAGAKQVDAVDIDSAIVDMGRAHHPEHPYDDPRVQVIIDDARNAFKTLPPQTYDAVVFGLLDSHTQLGTSSVRLDNYVFTQESFSSAARLLRPRGYIILSAVTTTDWFRERYHRMLEHACGGPVQAMPFELRTVYVCQATTPDRDPTATGRAIGAPIDDWPFPYLPDRGIPLSYVIVIGMLVIASVAWLRHNGIGRVDVTPVNVHMFFLGSAFLLMEVYAINRLALLFGTTWLVSAVSIAAMLVEIVAANLVVSAFKFDLRPVAYAALGILLVLGWFIGPDVALGKGLNTGLLYALFLLSPVFCAGIIFATSFSRSQSAGMALGANILGAVLGGWSEYATMATGIRFMALVALALYAGSLIALAAARKRAAVAA